MKSNVQVCDGGFICLICWKSIKNSYNMRRHMREIHVSSAIGVGYHCPPCDKYFSNQRNMKHHIDKHHVNWKGVNTDTFVVKK